MGEERSRPPQQSLRGPRPPQAPRAAAQEAAATRQPSAAELAADPEDLRIIREVYGSRAEERHIFASTLYYIQLLVGYM